MLPDGDVSGRNPDPLIVTIDSVETMVGEKDVISGPVPTVKFVALVAVDPYTVTVIEPVVAPAGTETRSWVELALRIDAMTPLNFTMLPENSELKPVPSIVTVVPTSP